MKKVTVFVSDDGKTFKTEAECIEHDKKIERERLWQEKVKKFNNSSTKDKVAVKKTKFFLKK